MAHVRTRTYSRPASWPRLSAIGFGELGMVTVSSHFQFAASEVFAAARARRNCAAPFQGIKRSHERCVHPRRKRRNGRGRPASRSSDLAAPDLGDPVRAEGAGCVMAAARAAYYAARQIDDLNERTTWSLRRRGTCDISRNVSGPLSDAGSGRARHVAFGSRWRSPATTADGKRCGSSGRTKLIRERDRSPMSLPSRAL